MRRSSRDISRRQTRKQLLRLKVEEPQPHEEPFSVLKTEGAEEAMPDSLLNEVFKSGVHGAKETFAEGEHKEEVLETLSETEEGANVQPEAEDIDKEPPSTPMVAKASLFLGVGHAVPASVAPGPTSS